MLKKRLTKGIGGGIINVKKVLGDFRVNIEKILQQIKTFYSYLVLI